MVVAAAQQHRQGGKAAGWDDGDDDATPPVRLVAGSARARLANHGELPLSILARPHMAVPKHQNGLGRSEGRRGGGEWRDRRCSVKWEKIRLELGAGALCLFHVGKPDRIPGSRKGGMAIGTHLSSSDNTLSVNRVKNVDQQHPPPVLTSAASGSTRDTTHLALTCWRALHPAP